MISYQLAKYLKDAGFPFREIKDGMRVGDQQEVFYFCPDFNASEGDSFKTKCHFYAPTLSELIEACGEDFKGLLNHREERGDTDGLIWCANALSVVCWEKTPEEAVANLWLALNAKI